MAKTSVDEARVRELLGQGCTPRQVAERLGLSKTVVLRIRSGERERRRANG